MDNLLAFSLGLMFAWVVWVIAENDVDDDDDNNDSGMLQPVLNET